MRELFTIVLQFRESIVGPPLFLQRARSDELNHRTTSIIIACPNRLVGMPSVTQTG